MDAFNAFLAKVETQILVPIITLLALGAFILFVAGVVAFIRNADAPDKRATGLRHILWGLIGLVIIFGANAILSIMQHIVGTSS